MISIKKRESRFGASNYTCTRAAEYALRGLPRVTRVPLLLRPATPPCYSEIIGDLYFDIELHNAGQRYIDAITLTDYF